MSIFQAAWVKPKLNPSGVMIFNAIAKKISSFPFWRTLYGYRRRYVIGLVALTGVDAINVVLPLVVREAVDALLPKSVHTIIWAAVIYLGLTVVQSVGRYLWRMYLIGTSHLIASEMRRSLYAHLQKLPLHHYQRVRTGDLMSRATNDIESVRTLLGPGILVIVDACLMFLLLVPVMFYLSPKLALLAFAFYPIVPWLTARVGDRIDTLFEMLQERLSGLSAFVQESFGAIRLIKSLVLESTAHDRFRKLSEEYRLKGVELSRVEACLSPALGFITNLGTLLILIIGGMDVMQGVITVGTFVAFQRFVVQLSWPMEAIGWAVTMSREGLAAERRLGEIFSVPEVQAVSSPPTLRSTSDNLVDIRGLRYGFPNGNKFHLSLHDLSIKKGQKIGLVGPVGSGKSTLFNLLLRLYEPPECTLYFGGLDIRAIDLGSLRRSIASVEQQIFLFGEKISVNITMGFEKEIPPEEIRKAAHIAYIDEEIGILASGFDSLLGERGVNLSGGQKQRVALARALVRRPRLLLLDDCFSAVDVAVEHEIIRRLLSHYPDLTLCFASHRMSVMPTMDEVWVLENGELEGRGTHLDLLKHHRLYQVLWEHSAREKQWQEQGVRRQL